MFNQLIFWLEWRATAMHKLVSFAQPLYRRLSRRNQSAWEITNAQLLNFKANTLGRSLGGFLHTNQFTLMAQFESHDVFHVLLGYKPTVLDEARMQYCLIGSGRRSLYAVGTCVLSGLVYPDYLMDFRKHYQRGCGLEDFSYWDFEAMLGVDIGEIKKGLKNKFIIPDFSKK